MPESLFEIDRMIQRYGETCRRRKPQAEVDAALGKVRHALESLKADALSWRTQQRRIGGFPTAVLSAETGEVL